MRIYNPDGIYYIDPEVNDSSYASEEIMNEDVLSLEFEATEYLDIPVESYCDFLGKRYYLLRDSDLTKQSNRNYEYKLVMYTDASKAKDVKYGFATVTKNVGELPKFDYAKKIVFSLTGKPVDFAQLWVDNMNIANNTDEWTVGECIDAPLQTLDFNDQDCFSVLGQITDAFETEWNIENKTLSFAPVEFMKDSPTPLSYGEGNGLVKGVSRVNYSDGRVINRIIVKGSDRNIAFSNYGDTTLHLPKNASIKYDGNYFSDEPEFVDSSNAVEYVTDGNGSYIERSERTSRIVEDSLDCTTIYPMHEGTITRVDENNNLIFFDDDNEINYLDALIEGQTMQLIPQSGDLKGKEFEVNYSHTKKRFTLKRIEGNNDVSYPSGNLIPRVGDKYAIFKINLPHQYIDNAEHRVLKACAKFLYEKEVPQYTYAGVLDPIYSNQHWDEIGEKMRKGYFVNIFDPNFNPDGSNVRVTRVEFYVNRPTKPKITLSNKVTGKSFSNRQNKIDNQDQTIGRQKEYTAEKLRETDYLKIGLANKTQIDGGVLLTTLIQMGLYNEEEDVWVNTAGMSGIYEDDPNDIFLYGGGTLQEAINLVNDPYGTTNVANFVVTHGGQIIANNAIIKGHIEATSGSLGGFDLIDGKIVSKSKNDNGQPDISLDGTGQSSYLGLKGSSDLHRTYVTGDEISVSNSDFKTSLAYHIRRAMINHNTISLHKEQKTSSIDPIQSTEFSVKIKDDFTLEVILDKLPKSSDYLKEGQLWDDNGVLKIHHKPIG